MTVHKGERPGRVVRQGLSSSLHVFIKSREIESRGSESPTAEFA
jgi:hypothetical protein